MCFHSKATKSGFFFGLTSSISIPGSFWLDPAIYLFGMFYFLGILFGSLLFIIRGRWCRARLAWGMFIYFPVSFVYRLPSLDVGVAFLAGG